MAIGKWKIFLRVLFILIMILTVICLIPQMIIRINNPPRGGFFKLTPTQNILLEIVCIAIFFIPEYGIYSSIKYFIFKLEKNIPGIIWAAVKLVISVLWLADLIHLAVITHRIAMNY